jgi:hypothetical protein
MESRISLVESKDKSVSVNNFMPYHL